MAKQQYIRCPRCELNYILKKDKYCSVCKAEMQVGGGELDEYELCPICKTNYIGPDEVMCSQCMEERKIDPEKLDKDNDEWIAYINREDEDDYDSQEDEVGDATIKDDRFEANSIGRYVWTTSYEDILGLTLETLPAITNVGFVLQGYTFTMLNGSSFVEVDAFDENNLVAFIFQNENSDDYEIVYTPTFDGHDVDVVLNYNYDENYQN